MAIVEMAKITLVGMTYHKENILNALHKTCSVELSETFEFAETLTLPQDADKEKYQNKFDKTRLAVEFVVEQIEKAKDRPYYPKSDEYLRNFFVSYQDFVNVGKNSNESDLIVDRIQETQLELSNIQSERVRQVNLLEQIKSYKNVEQKFSYFTDTKTTKVFFGTIKSESLSVLETISQEFPLTDCKSLSDNCKEAVVLVVAMKEQGEEVLIKLMEKGFAQCVYNYNLTPKEKINELQDAINDIDNRIESINQKICSEYCNLRQIKILSDYYGFMLEKIVNAEKFRCTDSTFVLEGYLPKDQIEQVKSAVNVATDAVFMEFSDVKEGDTPPTLLKNNKVIRQAEFVTDMYSVPNYKEADPNKFVFFFFMLFMGVIMADIGYGILMILLGFTLASRIKVDNGSRRLWNLVGISGIFAIIFGVLFNSLFGFAILPFSILPSPVPQGENIDGLMIILVSCLGLGVLHIMAAYLFKAINCFKSKDIAGAIFDGLIWVLFFIGFVFASFNFLVGYLMPNVLANMNKNLKNFFDVMATPGLIILVVALVIATLTAGRSEKGFGKFSKGFGTVYGLINLMSDILSYARLFGLMLSGMIIASTFNDIGGGLLAGGGIGYIFGPLVMVIGHVFNIAMGVLGAYIHDSRLQYIEFFSKFYTGEGKKFTPLGSEMKYIYLKMK